MHISMYMNIHRIYIYVYRNMYMNIDDISYICIIINLLTLHLLTLYDYKNTSEYKFIFSIEKQCFS